MPVAAIDRREAEDALAAPASRRQGKLIRLIPPAPLRPPELLDWARAVAAAADRRVAELEARVGFLEGQIVTDELTGLLNRRGFINAFQRANAAARRGGPAGVVVACDLDGFKGINDRLGHAQGDGLLRQLGGLLRRKTRRMDAAARIGGDEFALLLIGASLATAKRKCLCLARSIESLGLRASFGCTVFDGASDDDSVLHRADMAMYEEKRRNAGVTRLPVRA